ncbi:pilus assembly PilX N-terminal domain-containing protein [Pseudocolwellia sp. AS88]|uniref:pilus assembly PilX family protein n=1 Tax=Pseudocolwellia sp. AS88 TaxID=3063958 RepID=UPI0026EF3AF8|nr:pilus assembly PilX N-terminal domain-containing protein [Pseudocolwellia sp. AS88]MDO7086592.1 pilus assembly PilX N-terminal domain-containing protein [Pseudocolwellia sp. AS88]
MKSIYLINTKYQNHRQQGVVLIVALVFLIALTAVAAALMQNTTTDIKMAGASQEKAIVTQEAISEMGRIIFNEYRKVDGANAFSEKIVGTITFPVTDDQIMNSTGVNANEYGFDVSCPRNTQPTSGMKCTITRVQITQTYGRDNNHAVQVNSGIAQELPAGN